ncbi:hypothetical protein D068_cds29760 [Bacillus atrophaeus UCMB-5137]|nr:hypothetical protein D068_cds29760 [Bacillus atrophaeus UCMB-5137]
MYSKHPSVLIFTGHQLSGTKSDILLVSIFTFSYLAISFLS